jgi:hypothetical protein
MEQVSGKPFAIRISGNVARAGLCAPADSPYRNLCNGRLMV